MGEVIDRLHFPLKRAQPWRFQLDPSKTLSFPAEMPVGSQEAVIASWSLALPRRVAIPRVESPSGGCLPTNRLLCPANPQGSRDSS